MICVRYPVLRSRCVRQMGARARMTSSTATVIINKFSRSVSITRSRTSVNLRLEPELSTWRTVIMWNCSVAS